MSCCGGGLGAVMVQGRGLALLDGAAALGAMVKLVYTGEEVKHVPYVAEGKPYFFGAKKRVNGVPARVAPQFLDPAGRYYGPFVRFDPALHLASGEWRLETGVQGAPQRFESGEPLAVISEQRSGADDRMVTLASDMGGLGADDAVVDEEAATPAAVTPDKLNEVSSPVTAAPYALSEVVPSVTPAMSDRSVEVLPNAPVTTSDSSIEVAPNVPAKKKGGKG